MNRFQITSAVSLALILGASTSACAAWEVISPNPAGSMYTFVEDVSGGQQVGNAVFGDEVHAALWHGTAASWVDLSPAGSTRSNAVGVSGGQQTGHAAFGDSEHAGLWSGRADSWVDLHPAASTASYAGAQSNRRRH